MSRDPLRIAIAYLTIYLVWGSTYFFISLGVETVPPYLVLALRFTTGGILLFLLALGGRRASERLQLRQFFSAILVGSILLLGANGLITIAEQEVDSYLVALVLATTPLQVAFLERVLYGVKISALRVAGILIGVAGVAVLLYDGRSISGSLTPRVLMVAFSSLLWSFGTCLGKRLPLPADNRLNSGIQMLFTGVVSLAIALAAGLQPARVLATISLRSAFGVAYLGIVGSLAFAAYTFLIAHEPPIRIVSYALVNPGIAVLLGLLIGKEEPMPYLAVGLPMVLVGLTIMLYGEWLLQRLAAARRRRGAARDRHG